MATSVSGLVTTDSQATRVVESLTRVGFPLEDVSVLFPDQPRPVRTTHQQVADNALAGGAAGGVLGGALGWMAGIGLLIVPGIGPLIAAGPVMAALGGAAIGVASGGLAGTLIGLGIPASEAKRFENRIRQGSILVSVLAEPGEWTTRAEQIFHNAGAEDIHSSSGAGPRTRDPRHATTILMPGILNERQTGGVR